MLRLRERVIQCQGSRTVTDYLTDVKCTVYELALLDHAVSEDELTIYILNGLSKDYENIVAAFRIRDTPIFFKKIYEKLTENASYKT